MIKGTSFTPLDARPKPIRIGAFDLEGDGGERGFISAAVITDKHRFYTESREEFYNFLGRHSLRGYSLYAHNLTYDFGMIMGTVPYNFSANMINGQVYKVKLNVATKQVVYLRDSLGMFAKLPLSALGKQIGLEKYQTPPTLLTEPLDIPEWSCDSHGKTFCIECYNLRDVEIVYRSIVMLQEWINGLGSSVKNTLAATAMNLYRTSFMDREYYTPFPFRNDFARKSYYGGRTEDFRRGKYHDINYYDVNSLYPSVMKGHRFADPNHLHGPSEPDNPNVIQEYEGASEVTIRSPQKPIPVLPLRYNGKLYFPTGTLRGTWTHVELRYAMEQGYKVLDIHKSLWSDKTCQPFDNYVQTLYNERKRMKTSADPREVVVKIMLNSLYGKFGQRSDSDLCKLVTVDEVEKSKSLRGWGTLEIDDDVYFTKPLNGLPMPMYINTLWASQVSSLARIELHKAMQEVDFHVAYCDTDSIMTSASLPTGGGLGEWKTEEANAFVSIYGPKLYEVLTSSGTVLTKAKGVPRAHQSEYLHKRVARYQKPVGIREASVRSLSPSQWVWMVKRLLVEETKRYHWNTPKDGEGCTCSRPWSVSELSNPRSETPLLPAFA